ncbi:citrate synthase [Burkholderia ambifaria]|nr:citrate synthase [Burkholderia ambifaria]
MQLRLPRDAAFGLFSIARSVGLLAHCIERVGNVIRPRSRYTGPTLDERHLRPEAEPKTTAHCRKPA